MFHAPKANSELEARISIRGYEQNQTVNEMLIQQSPRGILTDMKESWKPETAAAEKRKEPGFPNAEGNHLTSEQQKDLKDLLSQITS